MSVRVSTTRGNFWGLVEQKGPWKSTATDIMRSQRNQPSKQSGGGIQIGGTKNAGHAGWYASMNPNVDATIAPPLPKPSQYVQKSIIVTPRTMKKGVKGSILYNSPIESMRSETTSIQRPPQVFQQSQQEATGRKEEDLESMYTSFDTPQSQTFSVIRNPFTPGPNLTDFLTPATSPVYDETIDISPSTNDSSSLYETPMGSPIVYETPIGASPTDYGTPKTSDSFRYPSIPSTPTTPSSFGYPKSNVSNTPILFNETQFVDQGTSPMESSTRETNPINNTSDKNVGTVYPWNEIVQEFNNFREQWQATSELLNAERHLTSAQGQEIQRLQQQAYQIDMMMTQLFDQAFPGKDWRSLVDQNRSLPQNLEMMWNTFSNDPELLKSIAKRMLTLTDKMKQVTDQGTQTSPQKKRPRPPRILTHFTRPSSTSDPNSSGSSYKPSATPSDDSNKGNYMDLDEPRRNIKRRVQLAKKKFQ